jgi:hypothetical protein
MKSFIAIFILGSLLDIHICKFYKSVNSTNNPNMCLKIDSLVKERYEWKTGNYYSNKILPQIINESGLDANCKKGTYGYIYMNDSLFDSDIKKWKEIFKCK